MLLVKCIVVDCLQNCEIKMDSFMMLKVAVFFMIIIELFGLIKVGGYLERKSVPFPVPDIVVVAGYHFEQVFSWGNVGVIGYSPSTGLDPFFVKSI